MLHRLTISLVALSAVTLPAPTAWAQLPPATDAQKQAGMRVKSVRFEPSTLTIARGDTTALSVVLLDDQGQPVEGAAGFLVNQGGLGPQFAPLSAAPVRVFGRAAGPVQTMVLVRVPDDEGGFQGITGVTQVGAMSSTIAERPAARIQLHEPTYVPYAGSSFKLMGEVFTDDDRTHSAAKLRWRSENPSVAVVTPGGVLSLTKPGEVTLTASTANGVSANLTLRVRENPVAQLDIEPIISAARTGDVIDFEVAALDSRGRRVGNLALAFSVVALDSAGAQIFEDGAFVAENPGSYRVLVSAGDLRADAFVEVEARPAATPVRVVGRGPVTAVTTSDLWVFEGKDGRDYAYTGTHAQGGGERMFVWDVTDPSNVVLMDSVVVDARVVNDVKVNTDASWAIITREGASDRRNGIVVLDLTDPAHPTIIAELTDDLTAGIHNVWINGDIVYAVNDGTRAINIIDMSNPAAPTHAGRWELRPGDPNKSLHDVWSDGDYAYVSYWDDGLVVLDVGAGTHGGTPTEPTYVSSIAYGQGNTHVAWREGDYVFLGDEIFGCAECVNGPRGYIHVVDVSDLGNPVEVAKYEVPEAGAHNIWVEDGVLYVAYYQGGLRMVDVSGKLRGDLYRQGREIGWLATTADEGEGITINSPMAWGPQPYKGHIFVSDMNSGLWVVEHQRPQRLTP